MTTTLTPAQKGDPDFQLHAFRTFLGLPPDTDTSPACGATLTAAYDTRPWVADRPHCPACDVLLAESRLAARRAR